MDAETTSTETLEATEVVEATALGGAEVEAQTAKTVEVATEVAKAEEAPVVPETYDLTFSDGVVADPVVLEAAVPVFKELGLSNEAAQKLVPIAESFAKSIGDGLNKQILDQVTTERASWLTEAKSDEEIGGDKWDASLVTAAKALDALGFKKGSAFRSLLNDSGLGNHPEMIRAFVKVGKAISEDTEFTRGDGAQTGARTVAQILYPPKS